MDLIGHSPDDEDTSVVASTTILARRLLAAPAFRSVFLADRQEWQFLIRLPLLNSARHDQPQRPPR